MEPDGRKQKRARADRAGASTLTQSSLHATFSREGPPPANALAYAASRCGGSAPSTLDLDGLARIYRELRAGPETAAAKAASDGAAHLDEGCCMHAVLRAAAGAASAGAASGLHVRAADG